MRARTVTVPTLALIAGTRGMLGAGLGPLLASRLSDSRRRGVGRSLLAIGLLSTIPLVRHVFRRGTVEEAQPQAIQPERRSGGAVDAPGKHRKAPPPSRMASNIPTSRLPRRSMRIRNDTALKSCDFQKRLLVS